MASVNKKFAVEKGLEVGDNALVVDADNNKTGIGKTNAKYGLDVATTANFDGIVAAGQVGICLLYTSPSPRDVSRSRMPSSA